MSEVHKLTDGSASESAERKVLPLPKDFKATVLVGIFCLIVLYALYLTGEIVVPVIIALLLKMVLQPATEILVDFHLPRFVAAFLVVSVLLGVVFALAFLLSGPAASWVSKAPASFAQLERRLDSLSAMARGFQKASQDVQKLGEDATTPAVAVKGPPLSTFLFSGTRALAAGLLTIVVLLFFLLVSGNSFLRRIVEILPTLHDKKQAVDIINEIQRTISVYFGTVTMMNALVGILTGIAAYFCGLSDPVLWGSVAFLLNFIPILGPLVGVVLLGLVGFTTFVTVWQALLPAGIYLLIHFAEGETITPMLLARRFTLNPVVVIIALVFWYWLWGVAGALLAVPMVATFKIVCDRVEMLKAIGHFLGTEAREIQPADS
ncbi:MAG TPA: AI-2E family transporter [Gemmataceae bacterium]|nr:AI-2E family transporter [Gemmataceae bacterium]